MFGAVTDVQKETILHTASRLTTHIQQSGKGSQSKGAETPERLRASQRIALSEIYARNEQRLSRQGVEFEVVDKLGGLIQELARDWNIKGGSATKHPSDRLLVSIAAAGVAFDQIIHLISSSGRAFELAECTDIELEQLASRCREFERRCLE